MSAKYHPVNDELRNIIIKLVVEEGKGQSAVATSLNIPTSTINRIVLKFRQTGIKNAGKKGGCKPSQLDEDLKTRIINIVNDNYTITVEDIIQKLDLTVHTTTVWRWLKKIHYSWKLTRPIPQKRNDPSVKMERKAYVDWYQSISPVRRYTDLIYLDESPFHLHMFRAHAWGKKGVTTNPILKGNKGPNVSMILALNCTNIVSSEAIMKTGVNSNIFIGFLKNLVKILGRNREFIIIMDNVPFHHSDPDFFDNYPYEIKYLPRYSPFLNPCEECFSQLKSLVRRDGTLNGTNDLTVRMKEACTKVTETHLSNYVSHAESFFLKCSNQEDIGRD